jgi:hypothetical protein
MHKGIISTLKVTHVDLKGEGLIFNFLIAASAVFVGIAAWTCRQFQHSLRAGRSEVS